MNTRQIRVGGVLIGGGAPISVQSMTNTDTRDVESTVEQLARLEEAGCQIARLAVFDMDCARAIQGIKARTALPLVADIHFDHKLAIASVENGIDKLRINPGNLSSWEKVKQVADAAKSAKVPIRIGVNGGSLDKELLKKYGNTAKAMVESAFSHIELLEKAGFYDIAVSLKASSVAMTVEANRKFAEHSQYPLHLGVTEAGTERDALIKSSMGIGALLLEGIGDTIRVSITGDPVLEVKAAYDILRAAGLHKQGIEVISCPTCGRTRQSQADLEGTVEQLKKRLPRTDKHIVVAVMGCVVNGPGEAREADVGVAFAKDGCMLFKKGEKPQSVPKCDIIERLLEQIKTML